MFDTTHWFNQYRTMKKSKELSEVLRRRTVDLFKCFQTQILGWSVQIIYVNASGSDMPPLCRCREKDLNCWPQMRGRMFRNILGFSKVQTCLGRGCRAKKETTAPKSTPSTSTAAVHGQAKCSSNDTLHKGHAILKKED